MMLNEMSQVSDFHILYFICNIISNICYGNSISVYLN